MVKFYDTEEFKALRDEWYEKAKDDGFNDIEIIDGATGHPGCMLRGVSPGDLKRALYKPETEEYYRSARKWVWRTKKGVTRQIWKHHAEGFAEKTIFNMLEGRYEGLTFYQVKTTIKRERARMQSAWNAQAERDWIEQ